MGGAQKAVADSNSFCSGSVAARVISFLTAKMTGLISLLWLPNIVTKLKISLKY
jgi:hypothetical protein